MPVPATESNSLRRGRLLLVQLGTLAALLALPEILVRSGMVSPFALAPTSEIAVRFWHLIADGTIVSPLIETLILIISTFIIVAFTGVAAGFCFWRWDLARRSFEPLMLTFYAIPGVIFYPILLVVLGIGYPSIMGLGFILGFVPVVMGVQNALNGVNPVLGQTATVLGASTVAKYVKVILPAALPDIGGALRLGFSYVMIGIISGQFLVSTGGLGKLVANYYDRFQTANVYAAAVFIILFAALINALLGRLR
jgi:ABC-type nitrate/sulfonate/bicarbonate transport system permease component